MYKKLSMLIIMGIILMFVTQLSSQEINVNEILTESMNTVDRVILNELTRLQTIANLINVKEGNWEFIKAALKENENERIKSLYWYCLPDGSFSTTEKDKVEANLKSRGYFPDLLAGKDVTGYPIIGRSSGKKSFVIAVPVIVDGKVNGILGTSVFLDAMWDFLKNEIVIPENYDFYAVNTSGIAMFDLETKEYLFDNVLEQTSPSLVDAIKIIISTESGIVTYTWNENEKTAIYQTSPVTNWRYVISYY